MNFCHRMTMVKKMNLIGMLSIVNLVALFLVALVLLYFDKFDLKNMRLSQNNFFVSGGNKAPLSMGDAKRNFLACITPEWVPETHRKYGAQFKEQLYDCLKQHIPIKKYDMDILKGINVEYKHFLPMDKTYYSDPSNKCLWLTAGIGNHTQAEQEFLKLYPRCKFFGIELVPENVADFGSFGTVINAGIGFDQQETVLANYTYAGIVHHNLPIKPLVNILDQSVGSRILHYAAIDIEGYEFPMLKEFGDQGQYYLNGVVICQMDIEWHAEAPGAVKDDFEFGPYMRQLFRDATSYLPVFAEPYHPGHPYAIKMTMINIKSTECELAFRFSKYFEK